MSESHEWATDSRLRLLVDGLRDHAIFMLEPDGTVATWSPGAQRLKGYSAHEIVGRSFDIFYTDEQRANGHPARVLSAAVANGVYEEDDWRVRKDGSLFWANVVITALFDADGDVVGFGKVTRDITDRRNSEQERAELQARLAEATLREERAKVEAQLHRSQRLETMGHLAGGIAHDFNNLLAGIISYANLVSGGLADEMADRGLTDDAAFQALADDVEEITAVANRAAELTRQLLTFSRREVVRLSVLDLSAVVTDMGKLLRRALGEGMDLNIVSCPGVPPIKADRGQIEQVCINLAVNARDAMDHGGRLTIRTNAVRVEELQGSNGAVQPGDYAELIVTDTGSGMSAEVMAHAFEPFFSTKPRGTGSGLGLATVYGIATQAGGDVVIDSHPGHGTTVRVLFPATSESVPAPDTCVTPRAPKGRGETVLLVEDEDTVREPIRRTLARNGYSVLAADSAEDALDIISHHRDPIDLLLTDVVMPGRSGKELAGEVSTLLPETAIVYMTGYGEDVIAHQGVLEPGITLIQKPFTTDSLLRTVRAAIHTKPADPRSSRLQRPHRSKNSVQPAAKAE